MLYLCSAWKGLEDRIVKQTATSLTINLPLRSWSNLCSTGSLNIYYTSVTERSEHLSLLQGLLSSQSNLAIYFAF